MLWNSLIIYSLHLIEVYYFWLFDGVIGAHTGSYWGTSSASDGVNGHRPFCQHQTQRGSESHSATRNNGARRQKSPAACGSLRTWLGSDSAVFLHLFFFLPSERGFPGPRSEAVLFFIQFTWLVSHSSTDTTRCARVVLWLFSARKWTGVAGQKAFGRRGAKKEKKEKEKSGKQSSERTSPV